VRKILWILTEERPKLEVVEIIVRRFSEKLSHKINVSGLRIRPIFLENKKFAMEYEVLGVTSDLVSAVRIKIVSGNSSFTDYLIYFQAELPRPEQPPFMVIEETKTDDRESRNTGVFQRASKFVYLDLFYPGVERAMLYNIQVGETYDPTETNIFGTRCLKTLGVEILGKRDAVAQLSPYGSLNELIASRSAMRRPPRGNVPIAIVAGSDEVSISGRLVKNDSLSHDPNIGALSLISATVRKLGWTKRIRIVQHGLSQGMLGARNKFVQIANHLDLEVDGLNLPAAITPTTYWRYEVSGEKITTILIHLALEEQSTERIVFENHAGCEKGYFLEPDGSPLAVAKRVVGIDGKMKRDSPPIQLPDLVIVDDRRKEAIVIEGERAENLSAGVRQLATFSNFEQSYLARYYPGFSVRRVVVLFGGPDSDSGYDPAVMRLSDTGRLLFSKSCPKAIVEAFRNSGAGSV